MSMSGRRLFPDLSSRRRVDELMDAPELDPERHRRALEGLARIHAWTGTARSVWHGVRGLVEDGARVLDVATGGGDVAVDLWRRARAAGIPVEVAGCDLSPVAVERARRLAGERGADVDFFTCDAVEEGVPPGYDVVVSSLFLHHLDDAEARGFLADASRACRRGLVVHDLVRSRSGYALAWLGCRLLSRSRIVHVDGPRSVRAAFSVAEARELARQAVAGPARVERRWPQRWLLVGRRGGDSHGAG